MATRGRSLEVEPTDVDQLPEYLRTSVGKPAFADIAIRLRDMAAFLAAQGAPEVAERVLAAYGALRAKMATMSEAPRSKVA